MDYHMERAEYNRIKRVNREAKIRKQKMCIVFALILFVFIITSFLCVKNTFAKSAVNEHEMTKYYKTITIYRGDTLFSIAERNSEDYYCSSIEYINEISYINHLSDNSRLIPGNYLTVPYYM